MAATDFEIQEITTKDEFARLNDVLWTANFHPYEPAFTIFHAVNGHTAEDRAKDKATDTDLQWTKHEQTPGSHYIYAIEKSTGRVVGGCEWIFYHSNPFPGGPAPVPCTWYPAGSERAEYASHVATQFLRPRQIWFQRPHAGVNRMGVHPEFRRRGIGRLLMQWGHYRVDTLGYETFIESGPLGRWLFEGCGYMRVMGLHIDCERKNPSEEWERLVHECRPPGILLLWRPPPGALNERMPEGPWEVTPDTWKWPMFSHS